MRREELYLRDIVDAADVVQRFVEEVIVSFRNIVVHEYFAVDWSIVWTTATKDIPELQEQITSILNNDYSN